MLYKVVSTFNSVDKTLVCDHSDYRYRAVLLISHNLQKEIWEPVFKGLKLDTLVLGGNRAGTP